MERQPKGAGHSPRGGRLGVERPALLVQRIVVGEGQHVGVALRYLDAGSPARYWEASRTAISYVDATNVKRELVLDEAHGETDDLGHDATYRCP